MKPKVIPMRPAIEIESGVPLPRRNIKDNPSYPFDKMDVSESFAIPFSAVAAARLRNAAWYWKRKNPGWNYAVRRQGTQIRLWRTAAIMASLLFASPAFAWDTPAPVSNTSVTSNGGNAKAVQHQSQRQVAAASAKASTRATGGAGGTASVSNTLIGPSAGAAYRQAPDVVLPSIGGGGMDCPTVGFGAGGSVLGGGGGFGPSWISSDCNHRKVTALLDQLYGPAVARAYAEKTIDGVREAVQRAAANTHPEYPFDWCYTRDAGNVEQRMACERRR